MAAATAGWHRTGANHKPKYELIKLLQSPISKLTVKFESIDPASQVRSQMWSLDAPPEPINDATAMVGSGHSGL